MPRLGAGLQVFNPRAKANLEGERPISMYVGRVAVEKTLDAFLSADIPGTKYVVGGGPDLATFTQRYPAAPFVGYIFGAELAQHSAAADVFVFPSKTDTFGLVMLEAMACGTPVAAYPVTGPIDVVRQGFSGVLDDELSVAVAGALQLDRNDSRAAALERTWEKATLQFLSHLVQAASRRDLERDTVESHAHSS